jgi:signal peptidase I
MFRQHNLRYSLGDMSQEPDIVIPESPAATPSAAPNPVPTPVRQMDVVHPAAVDIEPQKVQPATESVVDEDEDTVIIQPTVAPPADLEPVATAQDEEDDEMEEELTEEDEVEQAKKRRDSLKSALTTIGILIAAPLIAILLTTFVFQSYEVDGESMETTLQNNDRLIVWKLPVSFANLTSSPYIPARGEIIIFHKRDSSTVMSLGDKQLIKRVIGLPGERVVVRDGEIRVYNSENPDGFDPDATGQYLITSETTPGSVDMTVPEDEVFVVGDNRTNSLDSRAIGTIQSDEIIGELSFRIFPFNKVKHY